MGARQPQSLIGQVVDAGLCIGCGACVAACRESALSMRYVDAGLHQVNIDVECRSKCGRCAQVCAFSAVSSNEREVADSVFGDDAGTEIDPLLGHYTGTWVLGRPEDELRQLSASGGALTWFLETLLLSGEVDHVACVRSSGIDRDYSYVVADDIDALRASAGSAYRALRIDEVIADMRTIGGSWAVVAVPCIARSLRLLALHDQRLSESMRYLLGLTCGQTKTDRFTEWLCRVNDIPLEGAVRYRQKDSSRTSDDFAVEFATDPRRQLHWQTEVAPAWHARLFTPTACGICDDVFAECADAAFMDAWLTPYTADWRGTSLVVSRDQRTNELIGDLAGNWPDAVRPIPAREVIASQTGAIKEKRQGIRYRLLLRSTAGLYSPTKRVSAGKVGSLSERAIWRWEMAVSAQSCDTMGSALDDPVVLEHARDLVRRSAALRRRARMGSRISAVLRKAGRFLRIGRHR